VSGEPLPGWKVIGSFTHMDTEVLSDSNPAEEGLSIANTPDNKFTLFSTYTFQSGPLKDATLGGGAVFFDDRRVQGSTAPVYELPSFWRFDLTAGYRLGPVDLQVNLINLLDERYFISSVDSNEIYDGDPRTVLFTGSVRF
jgi:outer membrane receptor for monomeric catechols